MMLFTMNMTGITKLIEDAPRVVVFLHDRTNDHSIRARSHLADAIDIFKDSLIFVQLNEKDGEALIEKLKISAPHILFYNNGSLWTHCNFPVSETALLYMLNLFSEGPRNSVSSEIDLLRALGTSHFSLLYPQNERNSSTYVHRFATSLVGFVDLVPFTAKLARDFGLNESQMYLFRLEDVALIPVGDNLTEIIKATSPDFKSIGPSDFTNAMGLVLGTVINKMTPETVTFLEKMSEEKKENLTVGFISRPLHGVANITNGGSIKSVPSLVLFSNEEREYYQIPDEINNNFAKGNAEEAVKQVKDFLNNLPTPLSPSEKEPETQTGNTTYLVGTTHDNFVLDNNTDSVVLYVSTSNLQTNKHTRIFTEVANEFAASNFNNKIKFGIINATVNAADYPTMPVLPHIEIFPARNKSDCRTYYGQALRDDLVRFIKKYGSNKYDVAVPEATRNDISLELVQIYIELRSTDDDHRAKAEERIAEIAPVLGMTPEEINNAVFGNSTVPAE
jgi:hypothetical protein